MSGLMRRTNQAWAAAESHMCAGSTGRPKGVMVEGAGLVNFTAFMACTENLSARDVFLQKTPISFDASMRELMPPFLCGGRLVIAPPGAQRSAHWQLQNIHGCHFPADAASIPFVHMILSLWHWQASR